MSKRKTGRNIHGILLLDKRLGISSNRALQEVRRLFDANKAGHTGSLDPLASGLLPLCFGEATKVSGYLLDDDKRYHVVIQLGVITNTGDAEGEILSTNAVPEFTRFEIASCLAHFSGPIEQVPPMYSALKQNGKKLYELARRGETVDRKPRNITIFELELLEFSRDCLTLNVLCSKGTYIRSLAEDIGNYLGCGATVKQLRRLEVGKFKIAEAKTFEQLQQMDEEQRLICLINPDITLDYMPAAKVSDLQAVCVRNGQTIDLVGMRPGQVRIYYDNTFLGLGEMSMDGKLAPKKMFNMNIEGKRESH
jgi:tRNA pseudouridine55 synthase